MSLKAHPETRWASFLFINSWTNSSLIRRTTTTHAIAKMDDILSKQHLFPWILHELLINVEKIGQESVISWMPSSRSFKVHSRELFSSVFMKKYFKQSKYKSFQRQLVRSFSPIIAILTFTCSLSLSTPMFFPLISLRTFGDSRESEQVQKRVLTIILTFSEADLNYAKI